MRILLVTAVAAAAAFGFSGENTEWEDMGMEYALAHCITWDETAGRILVGTNAGYHSLDLATYGWTVVEQGGMSGLDVYSIDACCTQPAHIIVGRSSAQDHGYMEVTQDYGESWVTTHIGGSGAFRTLVSDETTPGRWLAGSISYLGTPGELLRSVDNGCSWTMLDTPQTAITDMTQACDGTIYSCGMPNVYRSEDAGSSWAEAAGGLSSSNYFNAIAAHPTDPGVLICSDEEGVYRTADGGESWTKVADHYFMDIDYWEENPQILAARLLDFSIMASTDGGLTWSDITGDLPGHPKRIAFCGDDGHLYAPTMYQGTYRTPVETTGTAGETGGRIGAEGLALSVSPNPVTATAAVSYTLPQSASARLDVFDVTGRLVRTLESGQMAAGSHQSLVSVSDSDPGVLFVRLSTESGSTVQKVLVSR